MKHKRVYQNELKVNIYSTHEWRFFPPGTSDNDYRALYKLLSSVWILLGLASVAMLLSNITDLYKRIAPESKTDDEEKDEKEKNENKVYKAYNFWLTIVVKSRQFLRFFSTVNSITR